MEKHVQLKNNDLSFHFNTYNEDTVFAGMHEV